MTGPFDQEGQAWPVDIQDPSGCNALLGHGRHGHPANSQAGGLTGGGETLPPCSALILWIS